MSVGPYTPVAQPGEGTKLMIMIGSVYTPVALVTEIEGPAMNVAPVETTDLSSPAHTYRPSRIPNPDKITMKIWFDVNDVDTHQLLNDRANNPGPIDDWKYQFNDQFTTHGFAQFLGFVTKFGLTGAKNESNIEADCEVQVSGPIAYTAGTTP